MNNPSSSQVNESAFSSLSRLLQRRDTVGSRRMAESSILSSHGNQFASSGGVTHPPPGAPIFSRSSMSGSIQSGPPLQSQIQSQSQPQVPNTWHFPCYGYSGAVQCDGDSWSAHHTYENSLPVSTSAPVDIPGGGGGAHDASDRSSAGSGATRARGVSMGERPRPVMPPGSPSRIMFRISQNIEHANLTDATMEMAIQALP